MELTTEFVKLIPSFLWFLLAVILILLFYKPVRHDLIPNLAGLKALGVELSFVKDSLNQAIELVEKTYKKGKTPVEISEEDKRRVMNRVRKHLQIFRNARILWIDDVPANNENEERMLRQLNLFLEFAETDGEAFEKLKKNSYDLILSDMSRHGKSDAGIEFLKKYQKWKNKLPVIFYVGTVNLEKGVPAGAFGLTHRPDELLHLALDALERKRY